MKNLCILFTLVALVFTGCQKEPTACFTASKTTAEVSEGVSFTNCTLEGVNYEWDFGDGATSTDENPTHAYTVIGTYTVRLKTTSKKDKQTDFMTQTITVVCPSGYEGNDCAKKEREKFLGNYWVYEACDLGYDGYQGSINKNGNLNVEITNFWNAFTNPVIAQVEGEHLLIEPQEPDFDGWWVQGSGVIVNGKVVIDFTVDDSNTATNCVATYQ